MSPGSLGRSVGREPSPVEVVKPGKLEEAEAAAEEAEEVAPEESAEEAVDAGVWVVFAVLELADLEGVGEAAAVESGSWGRFCATASEARRIEIARRESVETEVPFDSRMLMSSTLL